MGAMFQFLHIQECYKTERNREQVQSAYSIDIGQQLLLIMASDEWVPEIVIGIDFGMTCTGMFALLVNSIFMPPRSYSCRSKDYRNV